MEKEKIKPLPCYEEFFNYFVARAKRVLKLKNEQFESVNIEVHTGYPKTGNIIVWFHGQNKIIAKATFHENGRIADKSDYRS